LLLGGAAVGVVVWMLKRPKWPTPEEIEQARRELLASTGRITDGSLIDGSALEGSYVDELGRAPGEAPPHLRFRYMIAGVTYEAVQDVSALPDKVQDLRMELPIQVRYDYHNPANSIVVAESWSGLRRRPGAHGSEAASADPA
jgi:hypothetical protein